MWQTLRLALRGSAELCLGYHPQGRTAGVSVACRTTCAVSKQAEEDLTRSTINGDACGRPCRVNGGVSLLSNISALTSWTCTPYNGNATFSGMCRTVNNASVCLCVSRAMLPRSLKYRPNCALLWHGRKPVYLSTIHERPVHAIQALSEKPRLAGAGPHRTSDAQLGTGGPPTAHAEPQENNMADAAPHQAHLYCGGRIPAAGGPGAGAGRVMGPGAGKFLSAGAGKVMGAAGGRAAACMGAAGGG